MSFKYSSEYINNVKKKKKKPIQNLIIFSKKLVPIRSNKVRCKNLFYNGSLSVSNWNVGVVIDHLKEFLLDPINLQ